jgi:hypothetical protein
MENNPITIDRGYLRQAKNELEHWITVVAKRIYRLAGREFNIGSPAEVGKMLKDMKVPIKTNEKTGNAKTGADEIEELAKEHPICEGILLWRSLIKEKSTYVEALLDCTSEEKPNAVFKFRSVGAPTGRFASGGRRAFLFWKGIEDQQNGVNSIFQPVTGKLPENFEVIGENPGPVYGLFYASGVKSKSTYIQRRDIPNENVIPQDVPYKYVNKVDFGSCLDFPYSTTIKPAYWKD